MKIAKLVPQVDHLLTGILIKANEWLVEFLHLFVSLLLRTAESLHQFYLFSEDFAQIWSIVPLNLEWLAYSDLDELEEANKSADIIQNVTRKGRLDKEFSDQVASSDSVLIDINLGEDCHALLNALCFQILNRVLLKLHPRYLNSVGGLHFVSLLLKLGLSFDHFCAAWQGLGINSEAVPKIEIYLRYKLHILPPTLCMRQRFPSCRNLCNK